MKQLLFTVIISMLILGCAKDDSPTAADNNVTDSQLLTLIKNTSAKTFYKFSTDTLTKAGNSAHPESKLRTWYNAIAATQLTAQGIVKPSPAFADSSLIVKEIYKNDGTLSLYAILFKRSSASNKGPGDWVWSEIEPNGTPIISASDKGSKCASCHTSAFDFTRMNDAHP